MKLEVRDHIVEMFRKNREATWKSFETELVVSEDDFKKMMDGQECRMAEDRWAIAFLDNELFIVRFTGIPIYHLRIEPFFAGARVTSVKYNSNRQQVSFSSERDVLTSLIGVLEDFLRICVVRKAGPKISSGNLA